MAVQLTINVTPVTVEPGPSLFDFATKLGLHVPSSCDKQGKCGECLMEISEGMPCLSPPAPEENHLGDNFRLACRCRLVASRGTVVANTLHRATMRVEDAAINLPARDDADVPDPAVCRDGGRILLDGVEIARSAAPLHGLAVDLGTTTVVLRLLNIETGTVTATASMENPQRFGGTDVLARIRYDTTHPGRLLQRTLIGYMNRAIRDFPVDPQTIYEMVVVGNPTMRDLFFGLDVTSLGQKPYHSSRETLFREGLCESTAISTTAGKQRIEIHPKARIYGLPLVGGHVGADAAACLLAIDIAREDRLVALMDLGTNTELFIGNRHRILAASCPAGPAFEGRSVSCGMPGLDGAIEHIRLDEDGTASFEVIGDGQPAGICGSGLIELLGELRRRGLMNACGRFEDGEEPFVVDGARDIVFRESDVNELAQAKGANAAGLRIVANNYGIDFADLDVFYLAGGFGRHINLEAARSIGLVPDLEAGRIVRVGNAALEGASIALLSMTRRRELEELVRGIQHVELETDSGFFDHFVTGCQFAPLGAAEPAMDS